MILNIFLKVWKTDGIFHIVVHGSLSLDSHLFLSKLYRLHCT